MTDKQKPKSKNQVAVRSSSSAVTSSLDYLTHRLAIHQQTELAKAEAALGRAETELREVTKEWDKAGLELLQQLAISEAYDFEQDKRINRVNADTEEIKTAIELENLRHEYKMTKKRKRTLVENLVERISVFKSRRVDFELNYVPGQSIVNSERKQWEV